MQFREVVARVVPVAVLSEVVALVVVVLVEVEEVGVDATVPAQTCTPPC
jgi:formate-dependent phosphoribosylglycinamide formyltransferase (GAR transformylase)